MNCKYIFNNKPYTRESLFKLMDNKILKDTSIEDIIFSAENTTKQASQVNAISILKTQEDPYITVDSGFEQDGGYRGKDGQFSIGEFLDNSGEAVLNGKRIYDSMNIEEYKIHKMLEYSKLKKSPAEAQTLVDREINKWQSILKFSQHFHKIGISKYIGGTKETEEERKLNFVEQAKEIMGKDINVDDDFLKSLFNQLTTFYMSIKGHWKDSQCFRGINVTSKLKNSDTKLFSHIDYAIIDNRGRLHIYNFKVTSQFYGDWNEKKKEKYELEQAFIKQMLANNGIDIKGIELHNVPVKIDFDSNFEKATNSFIYDDYIKYGSKYDNIAKYFIPRDKIIIQDPSDAEMDNNNKIFEEIFPSLQVEGDNINKSVADWIKRAPAFGEEEPITIRELNDGEHSYAVTIEGKVHLISDFSNKEDNKEIKKLVKDHIKSLNEGISNRTNEIADAIQHSFDRNLKYFDFSKINQGRNYLGVMLKQYMDPIVEKVDGKEVITYRWELLDNLIDCGILLFRNIDNNQIDMVVLSSENLNLSPRYDYGSNILGGHLTDRDFQWKGTYGNIETVRGMVLLDSIIPNLPKDVKLGNIKVVSQQRMSYQYNIEFVAQQYMKDIYKTVKKKKPDLKINNNFGKVEYVDYFEDVVRQFTRITQNEESSTAKILKDIVGESLNIETDTKEEKRAVLLDIMDSFSKQFPEIAANPILTIKDQDKYQKDLARFFIQLSQAYLYYSGERLSYEEELSTIDKYLYTAPTIPDQNINIVVTNLQTTIDSISEECDTEFSKNILPVLKEFYKSAGYTSFENFTLGTQNRLFTNLFQTDSKGNRILVFKDPYTDISLEDYERKFLKKVLFLFNKYRFKDEDNKHFTSEDDPEIPKYILSHGDYLNVPLMRASSSTHRQRLDLKDKIDTLKRITRQIVKTKGKNLYNEFVNNLTEDEAEIYRQGFESMRFSDPFNKTDAQRNEYIEKNGISYFETNVENILIERLFNSIYTEKINRTLLGTKALLLQMDILGTNSGTEEVFKQEHDFIKKYIGLHVFKQPLIEKGISQKLYTLGYSVKKVVTDMNIAGNMIGAARDIENGFMENFIRTSSHYLTNIDKKNLAKAYAYVVKNGSMDATKMTLLSKLCVRYRLSNTDTARITERLKLGRQGLANYDNIMYSTLRAPDFLNRMTLFIARAMQDGVLDAWEVKDGELIYNWKKDKRFSLLADKNANKESEEYKKQRALYMLCIREWNKDHPSKEQQLNYNDDLPTPYSYQEILAIKQVSDNIYGSYDKMTRGMGDSTAYGLFYGMYTTWMNGIWNTWMMKPGKYNVHKMTTEQDADLEGRLLFEDENGNIYTETKKDDGSVEYINLDSNEKKELKELTPLLKHVPYPVQGIFYTLQSAAKILKNDGLQEAIKYITEDPNTMNSIRQLFITGFMAVIFALLFKFVIDPAYQETKKGYKDMQAINILMSEMLFRPLKPATDSLSGIYNVYEYLGEGMDPPIYNVPTKFIADAWKTAFGEKTAAQLITGNFAFAGIAKQVANVQAKA